MLGLGEILVDGAVQNQLAEHFERDQLFRPDLRSIEDVEVELVLVGFGNRLNGERPFRIGTGLYGLL